MKKRNYGTINLWSGDRYLLTSRGGIHYQEVSCYNAEMCGAYSAVQAKQISKSHRKAGHKMSILKLNNWPNNY